MRTGLFIALLLVVTSLKAQKPLRDTLDGSADDVVVTATRTERKLGNVAVPVTLINAKQIQQSGSLRLNDILQEQTGVFLTAGSGSNAVGGGVFGNGVQLQGLSPDHTMILLDGEPLIGRQGGVMDLSRFAVGNIKKIEIVKGPSSSLYGSEAMGGVINIITEPLLRNQFQAGIRYGSFATSDIYASGNWKTNKAGIYYFVNRNSGNGYELDPVTPEKTLDPYYNYTAQFKLSYQFSNRTKLVLSNRYFYGWQDSYYAINDKNINIAGGGRTNDYTINPVLTHQFSDKVKTRISLVGSGFRYVQQLDSLKNGARYYYDSFEQGFWRAENQTDWQLGKHTLTIGGGATYQTVATTRYRERKTQSIFHAFAQDEWRINNQFLMITGLRYDHNTDFQSRLSPKLALQWKPADKWQINASYGAGFKAPDFRQLYLSFVNNAADGYSIYGASEFSIAELQRQMNLGLVAQILPAAYQITTLKPEISNGFNLGVHFTPNNSIRAELNLFRNDVSNLINYLPVATNANSTSVFSYVNVNRAFTQGLESNIKWQLTKAISVQAGYQFLLSGDKAILEKVKSGSVYGRDYEGGPARLMQRSDYSGLLNRSKHMANLRVFYEDAQGVQASIRAIYRSRWGVIDRDGNAFANRDDEFANAQIQVNATIGKRIAQRWMMQLGVNNLFNQFDARFLPNIPGINYFTSVIYSFKK